MRHQRDTVVFASRLNSRLPKCFVRVQTRRSHPARITSTIAAAPALNPHSLSLPSRCQTSPDFVPWRFLEAQRAERLGVHVGSQAAYSARARGSAWPSAAARCRARRLTCLAAVAMDFQKAIAGIERVAECRRRLCRPAQSQHALVPSIAGQLVGFLRAAAARCSEILTELPKIRSQDLVPMGRDIAPGEG
jgi:hypothetical protein